MELPAGTELYPGTLTIDREAVAFTQTDNLLLVPVVDPSRDLRLCVMATGQGVVKPTVYIQFTCEGKTIRQPAGSVQVAIDAFDLSVTDKTFATEVLVSGTGTARAEIEIFDNGNLVGRTTAGIDGSWKLRIALHDPGILSTHVISAQMSTPTGAKVRSIAHTVEYQYAPYNVAVKKVTMHSRDTTGPTQTIMDFETGEVIGGSYTVYVFDPVLTFVIEFECGDMSRLSDVVLVLDLSDDSIKEMPAVYDAQSDAFVTSAPFDMEALPQDLVVRYRYEGELKISGEQFAQITQVLDDAKAASKERKELLEENRDELSDIADLEIPAEVLEAVAEYNAAVQGYLAAEAKVEALSGELFGTITSTDTMLKTSGGMADILAETKELTNFSVQDMVDEGYEVFQIGSDANDMLLLRTVFDEATGTYEQSLIDTTKKRNAVEQLAAGVTLAHLTGSKQVPMEVDASGSLSTVSMNIVGNVLDTCLKENSPALAEVFGQAGEKFGLMEDALDKLDNGLEKMYDAEKAINDKLSMDWAAETDPVKAEKIKQDILKSDQKLGKIDAQKASAGKYGKWMKGIGTANEIVRAAASVETGYGADGQVTIQALPAAAAAGKTVTVSCGNSVLVSVKEQSVTLDANGTAVGHFTASLPGDTELVFTLDGTTLCARNRVTVLMPAPHEHSYTARVTDPTCTAAGYTTYTCGCGESYTDAWVDALGHSWSEWEVIQEPTAAAPGLQQRTCGRCGETEEEEIPWQQITYGDVNGSINMLDLIILRQYLTEWDVTLGPKN